jgi:hypothetical protein
LYFIYSLIRRIYKINQNGINPHIDHKRKLIFIHNPKVAGTTLKAALKLPKNGVYHHYTPTFLVSKELWEKYFTIVAVREPVDRFISSYFEIVTKAYTGYFRKAYPEIYKLTPREYFELFKNEPFITTPQYRYATHFLSTKPIDFIIRFEHLNKDLKKLSKITGYKINNIPHLNKGRYSPKEKDIILKDKKLIKDIKEYYRSDYTIFGYDIDS